MTYASVASEIYGDVLHECVSCGGEKIKFWRQKNFQYTENANFEEFQIYRCESCGTGFLNRPPHVQLLQSIYQYSGQALTQAITLETCWTEKPSFPTARWMPSGWVIKPTGSTSRVMVRRLILVQAWFLHAGTQKTELSDSQYQSWKIRKTKCSEIWMAMSRLPWCSRITNHPSSLA